MRSDLLRKYEEKQMEDSLKMLKALMKKIKRGELMVMEHGFWEGSNGKWNFHVTTREPDNLRPYILFYVLGTFSTCQKAQLYHTKSKPCHTKSTTS